MYFSRDIDKIDEYKTSGLYPLLQQGKSIIKKILRRMLLKRELKLIIGERIVVVPFVWNYIFKLEKEVKILEVGCIGSEFPMTLSALGYQI